mmetsp:Transcript_8677/g.22658  ORF Transcript_8677/g.22658 Transcript_8677/m.22658 type:complete len:215 (+) Transcript_8677:122-766(+)
MANTSLAAPRGRKTRFTPTRRARRGLSMACCRTRPCLAPMYTMARPAILGLTNHICTRTQVPIRCSTATPAVRRANPLTRLRFVSCAQLCLGSRHRLSARTRSSSPKKRSGSSTIMFATPSKMQTSAFFAQGPCSGQMQNPSCQLVPSMTPKCRPSFRTWATHGRARRMLPIASTTVSSSPRPKRSWVLARTRAPTSRRLCWKIARSTSVDLPR